MTVLPNHILEKMSPEDRARLGTAGVTAREAMERYTARNERQLQGLIANDLLRRGIWYDWDATHKRRSGTLGTPDFLFAINGRACALEVKFGQGRLREDQERAIAAMRANGWRVAVVHGFEEYVAFLKEVDAA